LSEEANLAPRNNAGHDGWPTIRYFNKETGLAGADYVRRTTEKVCNELKIEDNMIAFIESAAMTTMCTLEDESGCDDSEKSFLAMMRAGGRDVQNRVLEPIKDAAAIKEIASKVDEKMQPDLKRWLFQRRKILKLLEAEANKASIGASKDSGSDEL